MSQALEQSFQIANKGRKINPENWEKFLEAQPPSGNIEDIRTPDGNKLEVLVDRFKRGETLTPSEKSWMDSAYVMQQIENIRGINKVNVERGFPDGSPRRVRPQEFNHNAHADWRDNFGR